MNSDMENDGGEPLRVLRDQELETSPDFMARVRSKIYRRTTTSQLVSYSWHLPRMVLVEMASVLGHLFSALGGKKDS